MSTSAARPATVASTPPRKQSDLAQWFYEEYVRAVGIADLEGGARFRRLVADFPARSQHGGFPYPLSSARRNMSNFLDLRMKYPLAPGGYACLALAAATRDGARTNYAYAYWRRGQGVPQLPEYVCVAATFDSRDGEYRPRFLLYSAFAAACEKYVRELAPYEEAVLALGRAGAVELTHQEFPAGGGLGRAAEESRLGVATFAVCLAMDLWADSWGRQAHTSPEYIRVLDFVVRERPNLSEPVTATGDRPWHREFTAGTRDMLAPRCGQKLVPMTLREVMQPGDFNLATWRELAVTQLAGDLAVNFVTPGVALFNQWSYIEGMRPSLFENRAMRERFTRSDNSERVLELLRDARARLAPDATNYRSSELGARLYEDLEYTQSFLTLSPEAMLLTVEDVGWTFHAFGAIIRHAPTNVEPAFAGAVATPDAAARLLFEYAYTALCLHEKLGVAHTDLHSNNFTVHLAGVAREPWTPSRPNPLPFYSDPLVMYVAGPRGEADAFVFPATGVRGCLIDYSRCILGPAFAPRLAEGRPPLYATSFYRDQVNRVMGALRRYAPDYVATHQNALKAATIANFEAVFPVLCAVDFIAIGAAFAAVLEAEAKISAEDAAKGAASTTKVPFVVAPGAAELARRLEEAGREAFVTGLHGLVRGTLPGAHARSHSSDEDSAKPTGAAVLRRVFHDWLFAEVVGAERARTAQLVDVYCLGNELRYSGRDYARFPPWGRFENIERHLGEHKMTDVFERGVEPFLAAGDASVSARVQVIAEQTRAAQERLDGAAVSTASSWVD